MPKWTGFVRMRSWRTRGTVLTGNEENYEKMWVRMQDLPTRFERDTSQIQVWIVICAINTVSWPRGPQNKFVVDFTAFKTLKKNRHLSVARGQIVWWVRSGRSFVLNCRPYLGYPIGEVNRSQLCREAMHQPMHTWLREPPVNVR
jgi:hypothetical protein